MTNQEIKVLIIISSVAVAWILRSLIETDSLITDSTIAIIGGIILFIVPVDLKKTRVSA